MDSRKILCALAIKFDGDWFKIFDFLQTGEVIEDKEVETLCAKNKFKYITLLDIEYPEYLKRCFRPPFVLFYDGDISLLNNIEKNLGVVGSRETTEFYISKTYEIITKLKKNIVIVSGLAKGIDAIAHKAALNSNKKTIGIIGCGLDVVYPLENAKLFKQVREKGLLISEYPQGSGPSQQHFPMRNRLITFITKSLFVPVAAPKSGSVITIGYAAEQGQDIYCLPSIDFGNSACNLVIKDGGILVENADDIMDFFH